MEQQKPNVVLIFTDQWRGDCLEFLGHSVVETPFLNEMASEGITFNSAYAAAPSCIPARACLATGQTPYTCGRLGYEDKVPWNYKNTMMEVLRNNGYQTMNVGKTHFYPQRVNLGFEINRLYDPQRLDEGFKSDYHIWLERMSNGKVKDTAVEWDNNSWVTFPWTGGDELHPTSWTAQMGKEVLEHRDPTRPFFLQLSFHRPHPPYDPPQYYFDMYKDKELSELPIGNWAEEYGEKIEKTTSWKGKLTKEKCDRMKRGYYASISHIDAQIGRFIHWLKGKGLYDNTYLIFLSDHGELLGDHYMYRKISPWEGSAKIPLIIKPPININCKRGVVEDFPTTHMDIMPTILEELGISIPEKVEGVSLSPIIKGENLIDRSYIHGEHTGYGKQGWQFVTDGKSKFIWDSYSGKEWYFDLTKDPSEERNLIGVNEYDENISVWRKRLVDILALRPEHGLSDGTKLISGKRLPNTIKKIANSK